MNQKTKNTIRILGGSTAVALGYIGPMFLAHFDPAAYKLIRSASIPYVVSADVIMVLFGIALIAWPGVPRIGEFISRVLGRGPTK